MSQRDRRAIPRVDYAALEAGRSPTALNTTLENACSADALNSPSTIVQIPSSQVDSHKSVFLELESLRAALATAKAENEQLLQNSEAAGSSKRVILSSTVLVSASSTEASVSQSSRALVPVSGVSVPVLSVSVDEGVYVPAASSAPVCTSVSVQVPRLQDSSVLVQASGIASSKSSSSSSSVTVPVCTVPKFCVSVVPASGDKSV